ncbi:uncharacterized protein STEHIDRAFT_122681 [Stereum hirsutum FP-91666 SS1]|uniref:uncharacterized protein n=1 Tax=Stereum hirsutum (strain FP-91666) TaxID=721885 RepID=UPI0004449479|nr:uncharacterized protein STEHIDRAFT_122681 [Stereum hirsutum FP-91666 SS1]EIM84681.1 hypothetical protein STEHIDRAFT_122681 [Stereum hirsutum FP-91666 SS1]
MAATALSGVSAILTFLYFRLYSDDPWHRKAMVLWLWALDATHTCLISASNWRNLILYFGDEDVVDYIPTTTSLTILFTCFSSLTAHIFYASMLWRLGRRLPSKRAWLPVPLVLLALLRFSLGINSTIRTLQLKSWTHFIHRYSWSMNTSYSASAAIDIYISTMLCLLLQHEKSSTNLSAAKGILDKITLYTVNNGLITCTVALMSLISWFAFRGTLVFLGTHFLIGKLYTCGVLSTLVMRRFLREEYYSNTILSASRSPISPRSVQFTSPRSPRTPGSDVLLTPPNSARTFFPNDVSGAGDRTTKYGAESKLSRIAVQGSDYYDIEEETTTGTTVVYTVSRED